MARTITKTSRQQKPKLNERSQLNFVAWGQGIRPQCWEPDKPIECYFPPVTENKMTNVGWELSDLELDIVT